MDKMDKLYCDEKLKSLQNIEKDMHSIDNNLDRIAVALERLSNCVANDNKLFIRKVN